MGSRKTTVYVLLALISLVLPAALPAGGAPPAGVEGPRVVDGHLEELLGSTADDEVIEVVVQFDEGILPEDRRVVDRWGLENLHEYSIIPAMWVRGPAGSVGRLAGYGRVTWMEHNERLQWMMDETTVVVNATRTWYSRIEGTLWGDQGVTGKGVTVVVVDSGIDAGHPDLDYGVKTIRNLKSDTGTGPWYEIENGDTSSGHGTHVAGTVAGNGDASAGQRAGVAPDANLIGLSVGEAVFVTGGLGGLEWTYEHSRPGNNPYNIRVCTNSWGGGGGQYDPGDAISQAINKLVYENNVVVSFAAGNSGGTGETVQASVYGNTPAAICVAASGRDGTYITDFSSKGKWDWVDTWPDVAAPGHNIQSTAARRTMISVMQRGADANPYYFPISGTSMATPHVAGVAALLFQAAPSLRTSDVPQDVGLVVEDGGGFTVQSPEEGSYGELAHGVEDWMEAPDTRIHEVELILKLTSDYIPPQGEADMELNGLTENQVPIWSVPGTTVGRDHDFSQGYGLINVHRAVGLALALERIRSIDPAATVMDAYTVYEDGFERKEVPAETDRLATGWSGEWTRFNDQMGKPAFTANLTRFVPVPEGAEDVMVTLSYRPVDTTKLSAGSLGFQIDFEDDGTWDFSSGLGPNLDGTRSLTVPASGHEGRSWKVGIYGVGFKIPRPLKQVQFQEVRMEVEVSVVIALAAGQGTILVDQQDLHAINGHLRFTSPSPAYSAGNVSVMMDVYNLDRIEWTPGEGPPGGAQTSDSPWLWAVLLLVVLLVVAWVIARFWPDSLLGRLVIRVGAVTGVVGAYRFLRARVARALGGTEGKAKVVRAELVEEGEGPT